MVGIIEGVSLRVQEAGLNIMDTEYHGIQNHFT